MYVAVVFCGTYQLTFVNEGSRLSAFRAMKAFSPLCASDRFIVGFDADPLVF